jgi:C4-dicarboxylate transporter DctM subunit
MAIGIFFLIFCVLMLMGVPVAVVFGGMTFLPSLMDPRFGYTIEAAIRSMVNGMDSFTLLAVPMFMFSGIIMARGGISEKLFNFFAYFVGNKTAGLPCAVILTCMFYAAISGSSPATVSAVGAMTIPFLIGLGYDKVFATAIVTVAGGLGVIIPPSISYIVYSSITNASPSALFIGGIIPGVLIGFCLMICAYIYCKKHGEDVEKLKATYEELHRKGLWRVFKESFFALLTPIIILGSIYGGIASPTEAAAISVIYALIISLFVYKTIKLKNLGALIVEGVRTYVLILFIIGAAIAFGRVMALLRYPQQISQAILASFSSKVVIILVINLVLLIFGMIMDNIPNIMVLTPILIPVATSIGMHPVHFGIMLTANLAIGMVTPPMGINLYVANSMTHIPVLKIARVAIPFLVSFLIALLLISFIPWLSLKLPGLG